MRAGRVELVRARQLRGTLRVGGPLVAAILIGTGLLMASRFPANRSLLLAVWGAAGLFTLLIFAGAMRPRRQAAVPLSVAFTIGPLVAIIVTTTEPGALLGVSSAYAMLPVAVPLFLAWTTRLRTTWLLGYVGLVGTLLLLPLFPHLNSGQRIDLISNTSLGALIGWVGGELLERLRIRSINQEVELRRLNRELRVRATTDALTGLGNRRQLDDDLRTLGRLSVDVGRLCAVIMIDFDRFKQLNDALGHADGDEALRRVSTALQDTIRARDRIYRYGGEEFLVIMPGATIGDGVAAAERMRAAVAALQISTGDGRTLTISCGVAHSLLQRERWEAVIAAADSALYEAKATGRDRVCAVRALVGSEPVLLDHDRRRYREDLADRTTGDRGSTALNAGARG